MEEEIQILDDKIFDASSKYYFDCKKIKIENLGIEINGLSEKEAKYIKDACKTRYGKILIEFIKNNPKFDLTRFMYEMQLEDIEKEEPSRILVSAKGIEIDEYDAADLINELNEHEEEIKPKFEQNSTQIDRLLLKGQAEVMKKCAEKNKYYNFYGPTQENHGFDIETFGVDFLSYLNHGLDNRVDDEHDYIYNTIIENPDLLEIIKNNSKAAKYMALAVNEYQYSTLRWNHFEESMAYRSWEEAEKHIDDFQKLKSLFKERINECLSLQLKDEIEMPEIDACMFCSIGDEPYEYAIFHPKTLMESNSIEYLKNSRKNEIIVNNIQEKTLNDYSKTQERRDEQLPVVQNKSIFRKILGKVQRIFKNTFSSNDTFEQLTDEEVTHISSIKEDKLQHVKGFSVSEEVAIQKNINGKTQFLHDRNQDNGER